jgi:hypothetical protein
MDGHLALCVHRGLSAETRYESLLTSGNRLLGFDVGRSVFVNVNYKRLPHLLLLSGALALSASAVAPDVSAKGPSGIERLTAKLKSNDFRMQVQAALILGKTGDARALTALSTGLKDNSVAVRAACAAALGTLGDPAALPALRRAKNDKSAAVKRRISSTISGLEKRARDQIVQRRASKVLVKFEPIRSKSDSAEAVGAAAHASRTAMDKVPQVAVLNASEDPQVASKRFNRPVIVVRASLSHLDAAQSGGSTTISAKVEFLVERFPSRSMVGRLSGNASVSSQVGSARERVKLQEEAVGAAVASALRGSGEALLAAVSRG